MLNKLLYNQATGKFPWQREGIAMTIDKTEALGRTIIELADHLEHTAAQNDTVRTAIKSYRLVDLLPFLCGDSVAVEIRDRVVAQDTVPGRSSSRKWRMALYNACQEVDDRVAKRAAVEAKRQLAVAL